LKVKLLDKFLFPLFFFGCICSINAQKGREFQKIFGEAQGTTYSIVFKGPKASFSKEEADSIFTVIDQSMSLWNRNSTLSKINRNNEDYSIDEHLRYVFEVSKKVYGQSDGAFDPTIGPIVKAYGFVTKNDLPLPSLQTIDSLLQFVGLHKVDLVNNKVIKNLEGISLDFNAIAQGYTVDLLCNHLKNKGIKHYLVEVGGEIRASGKNPEGKIWKIGIEKPIRDKSDKQSELQGVLALKNSSLATSGNYRNYIEKSGKRVGHILNPKTGQAVEHKIVSVSVIAPTCTESDAWATAFVVLGKEKSFELAKKMKFEIQVITNNNGVLETTQTNGFKKLLR
jgi:FAD:protein FMN transferase